MSPWARLAVTLAVVALAWIAFRVAERRRPGRVGELAAGLTLVTAPDCRLCPAALTALRSAAPDLAVRVVDAAAVPGVRSVPTVLLADRGGSVVLRRSGRSAITDAATVAAEARLLAGGGGAVEAGGA